MSQGVQAPSKTQDKRQAGPKTWLAAAREALFSSTPIPDHKAVCQAMAPSGWSYGGFDEGFYLFQREVQEGRGGSARKYALMECLAEDLSKENLALMASAGVTRDRALTIARLAGEMQDEYEEGLASRPMDRP